MIMVHNSTQLYVQSQPVKNFMAIILNFTSTKRTNILVHRNIIKTLTTNTVARRDRSSLMKANL